MDTSKEKLKEARTLCQDAEKLAQAVEVGSILGVAYDLPPFDYDSHTFTIRVSEEHLEQLKNILKEELNATMDKIKQL